MGTGLGPTLGFYSELADQVTSAYDGTLWKTCSDNSLFPMPRSFKGQDAEKVQEIQNIFKLVGVFVAKSIVDDRRIELPFS